MHRGDYDQVMLALESLRQRAAEERPPLSLFRKCIGVVLLVLAVLFLVLNTIVLAHFGWHLGQSEIEKWVQATAAGALPLFVSSLHPIYVMTWRPGHWYVTPRGQSKYRGGRPNWFLLLSVSVLTAVALVINFAGGLGVMATARKAVDLKGGSAQAEEERLRGQHQRLEKELSALPQHRPAATVESLVSAHQLHRFWRATNQCSADSVLSKAHRDYCAENSRLQGERKTAEHAGTLKAELATVAATLSASGSRIATQAAMAPMDAISANTGISRDVVQARLSLLFPLLLELMTVVPMALAMYCFRVDHRAMQDLPLGAYTERPLLPSPRQSAATSEAPQPLRVIDVQPEPRSRTGGHAQRISVSEDPQRQRAVLDEFWAHRVRRSESGQVPEATFYTHYQSLSAERQVAALDLVTFRRMSAENVRHAVEMGGVRFYCHLVPTDT